MKIILAPMEGVVDFTVRDLLTQIGGYDQCVTEFLRVTNSVFPNRVFFRNCPELKNHGKTPVGTPVFIQLLGSHPEFMAANARKAALLGAPGIDLNFGCPAKTVNKNQGGAILLKKPDSIYRIIKAVRDAVPKEIPVTAKMRLGYEDKSLALDNAEAVQSAGANGLTIHARTKIEGYKPPAHWEWIGRISEHIHIPVIANGDIRSPDDYLQCRKIAATDNIMIGRSAMTHPNLAKQIKNPEINIDTMSWSEIKAILITFYHLTQAHYDSRYTVNRIKQWLGQLRNHYSEAVELFARVKRNQEAALLLRHLLARSPTKSFPVINQH